MKSVLISGATGGLGRNAVEFASRQEMSVTALGRNRMALYLLQEIKGVMAHFSDLTNSSPKKLESLLQGVDAVWHCAAMSAPWGAFSSFYAANVIASENLYRAAATVGVPVFVHISTPALYFDFKNHLNVLENYRPAAFVNHYASTKAQAEASLQALAQKNPQTRLVILRPRAIFGPHDQVLLPRLLRIIEKKQGILTLPRAGQCLLDLTYVENVVLAMSMASRATIPSGSVYNITNQEPIEIHDALAFLFTKMGKNVQIQGAPYFAMDLAARIMESVAKFTKREPAFTRYSLGALAFNMTLDNTRAQNELGYRPIFSMTEGLNRTAHWMKFRHG